MLVFMVFWVLSVKTNHFCLALALMTEGFTSSPLSASSRGFPGSSPHYLPVEIHGLGPRMAPSSPVFVLRNDKLYLPFSSHSFASGGKLMIYMKETSSGATESWQAIKKMNNFSPL